MKLPLKSLNCNPRSSFHQCICEVKVKDLSGKSKLQELVEKAEFLKKSEPIIPDLWEDTWEDATKILDALQEQVRIAQSIFQDKNIEISEISRLDETLEKVAQSCQDFQDLFEKSDPTFPVLVKILDASAKLVIPFNFVSEVDTSMFGDHVWDVKKDKLFYGDFTAVSQFIANLHNFFTMYAKTATASQGSPLNNNLIALKTAGGQLLDEFLPGVVYRKVPELLIEIDSTAAKIAALLKPCLQVIDHKFFQEEINKARQCLSGLIASEKIRGDKPLKIEGFMGPKDKVKDLVTLFELLQF